MPCVLESRKTPGTKNLRTTYKVVARKSSRSSKSNIDYANLDAGVPADAERYVRLLATRKTVDGNFKKFKAHEVTDKWLYEDDSFTEPFLFEEPEGLGLTMPNPNLAIQQISKIVGKSRQSIVDYWKDAAANVCSFCRSEDPDRSHRYVHCRLAHSRAQQN